MSQFVPSVEPKSIVSTKLHTASLIGPHFQIYGPFDTFLVSLGEEEEGEGEKRDGKGERGKEKGKKDGNWEGRRGKGR